MSKPRRAALLGLIVLSLLGGVALFVLENGWKAPEPTEAGANNYCRIGPVGLSVESVRQGRIRAKQDLMSGRGGESEHEMISVRTRFKLLDTGAVVKVPPLWIDKHVVTPDEDRLKLTNSHGGRLTRAVTFAFVPVNARRTEAAVLTAANPEATDWLTFESAGGGGDLLLEVPADHSTQQPDGTFARPQERSRFLFRIPRALLNHPPPPTIDAGPGHWATVGPVSVCVESVRVGKARVRGSGGESDSKEDVLAVSVRVKLADPAARVNKPPFVSGNFMGGEYGGPSATLQSAGGAPLPARVAFGNRRIIGRQSGTVELSADKPETTDLLTFDCKAIDADELILVLWPEWQERMPDGTWVDSDADGEFRFRIPKDMWAK